MPGERLRRQRNLVQFTDRRGKVAKFSYDGLNRMTFAGYGWTAGNNV